MLILGIETSCDETASAIVENGTNLLSNVVASSQEMHIKTGGIIPESAAREQLVSIIPVVKEALSKAEIKPSEIDAIAVTVGPGLIGSLLVGVETAKTLSLVWDKPLLAVNHLVGHLYANWLKDSPAWKEPQFPAVGLVVSGGHTDLVYMENHSKITLIGSTRDDAAGEAFDKTARLLGLPYPGGPSIAKSAEYYLKDASPRTKLDLFPRPLVDNPTFDFSFSGLKTAVLRLTQSKEKNARHTTFRLSAEIQEAIVETLVHKSLRAISKYKPKSFLLAGGVAANMRLRQEMQAEIDSNNPTVAFHVPKLEYCTDNAAYIASRAYYSQSKKLYSDISANPQLTITDSVV